MARHSGFRIFGIMFLSIFLLLLIAGLLAWWYGPQYLKKKLISIVEEKTIYHLTIEELSFQSFQNITLHHVVLKPKRSKEEFNATIHKQADWITLKFQDLQLFGLDIRKLAGEKQLLLDSVHLNEPSVYVFRDKRVASGPYLIKSLPGHILRKLKYVGTVPLVRVKNAHIVYEEWPSKGPGVISISFSKVYASAFHFSSDSMYRQTHPEVIITGKGLLLDSVAADMEYAFQPADKTDKFTMTGNVGEFQATLLNRFFRPLVNAQVESGTVHHMHFNYTADNDAAHGKLWLKYDSLKITALKKNEEHSKSNLKTWLIDLVVKDKHNQTAQHTPEPGTILFKRNKNSFIFNYWFNAIKSGVLSALVNIEPEKLQEKLQKRKEKEQKDK